MQNDEAGHIFEIESVQVLLKLLIHIDDEMNITVVIFNSFYYTVLIPYDCLHVSLRAINIHSRKPYHIPSLQSCCPIY